MEELSIMSKDRVEDYRGRATMNTSLGTQTSVRSSRFEGQVEQQLLPRIPNEVTLDLITSKLPWRAIHNLRLVSRQWKQAIRQVYDARLRLNSTETLVVVKYEDGPKNMIALYSMRDKRFYFLPPIPHVDGGIPILCQCVSLDGKIYVLGGIESPNNRDTSLLLPRLLLPLLLPGCQKVYVLDLVGQRQWKQCASMQEPRMSLGCGVIHGKIYAFGGLSSCNSVRVSEVYDPKVDAWYPITPMISYGWWGHQVETVEGGLYVHGGMSEDKNLSDGTGNQNIGSRRLTLYPLFLEIYHPIKNEWRKVDLFKRHGDEIVFVARGKFYSMSGLGLDISVYDSEKGSWTHLHSFSFEALGPVHSVIVYPNDVLAVDSELLARVYCRSVDTQTKGKFLLQSRGFGQGKERIQWDKVDCSLSLESSGFMSPVRL